MSEAERLQNEGASAGREPGGSGAGSATGSGSGSGQQPGHQINPGYRRTTPATLPVDDYVEGIRGGDRTILARAITLIESTRPESRELAGQILEQCLPLTGNSVRIAVTGVPGAGKSTFIEAIGSHILAGGRKPAVLAVDPSSSLSGGSILGDKTRMPVLSVREEAFIRPSPAGGVHGGIARRTRETMHLCEAAGYDTVFVETVGVGQSETAARSMVDFFLLLVLGGAGDELQGLKRGIVEMADLIAVNKADGENLAAAERAKGEYENALSLYPPSPSGWKPPVVTCSALEGVGVGEIWTQIEDYIAKSRDNGSFGQRRSEQAAGWMHETIEGELKDRFRRHPGIKKRLSGYEKKVKAGEITPFRAAEELLRIFEEEK